MASVAAYSPPRNWNRLGLRGYARPPKPIRVPDQPVCAARFTARATECWTTPAPAELTDDELLKGAEEQGHFDFLNDPAEDIYTWEDGEEL